MEWAINIVPASGGPQLPLFRHGPVGGMGATARRLTRVFLRDLTQGSSHTPAPTKGLDVYPTPGVYCGQTQLLRGDQTHFSRGDSRYSSLFLILYL